MFFKFVFQVPCNELILFLSDIFFLRCTRLKYFKFPRVFLLILNEVPVIIGAIHFYRYVQVYFFFLSLFSFFLFIDGEARLGDPCSKEKVAVVVYRPRKKSASTAPVRLPDNSRITARL